MPLPLFPFQEVGAAFLANRERAGLFDSMGVGKSAQVVRAADLCGARRMVVICPAVARENWRNEFAKFQMRHRTIVKGTSIHEFVAWANNRFDVIVLSYEMAAKWAHHFHDLQECLDAVVIDEGHYLKNAETSRTRAILGDASDGIDGLLMWAKQAWWLTGTPVPNDPMDVWTFLRFSRCMPLNQPQFARRYFDSTARTYSTAHTPKHEMLPELHTLIGNNALRRSLAQTGIELPPMFITTSLVDGDTKAVAEFLRQFPGLDRRILDALETGRGLSGIDADHVATLRRLIGEAKALPYAATLLSELESGLDKMVVFGLHRDALRSVRDYLARHKIRCGLIAGDTGEAERQAIMHAFQSDPSYRVVIGNIKAAGTAITLTASAHIDMLETAWAPGDNAQAIKRVHRITQARNVRARVIGLARSFDQQVAEIVAYKTENAARVENFGGALTE